MANRAIETPEYWLAKNRGNAEEALKELGATFEMVEDPEQRKRLAQAASGIVNESGVVGPWLLAGPALWNYLENAPMEELGLIEELPSGKTLGQPVTRADLAEGLPPAARFDPAIEATFDAHEAIDPFGAGYAERLPFSNLEAAEELERAKRRTRLGYEEFSLEKPSEEAIYGAVGGRREEIRRRRFLGDLGAMAEEQAQGIKRSYDGFVRGVELSGRTDMFDNFDPDVLAEAQRGFSEARKAARTGDLDGALAHYNQASKKAAGMYSRMSVALRQVSDPRHPAKFRIITEIAQGFDQDSTSLSTLTPEVIFGQEYPQPIERVLEASKLPDAGPSEIRNLRQDIKMQRLVYLRQAGHLSDAEFQGHVNKLLNVGEGEAVAFRGIPSEELSLDLWVEADERRFQELLEKGRANTPEELAEGQQLWEKKRTGGGQFFSDNPNVALHYAGDNGSVYAVKLNVEESARWMKGTHLTPGGVSTNFHIPNDALEEMRDWDNRMVGSGRIKPPTPKPVDMGATWNREAMDVFGTPAEAPKAGGIQIERPPENIIAEAERKAALPREGRFENLIIGEDSIENTAHRLRRDMNRLSEDIAGRGVPGHPTRPLGPQVKANRFIFGAMSDLEKLKKAGYEGLPELEEMVAKVIRDLPESALDEVRDTQALQRAALAEEADPKTARQRRELIREQEHFLENYAKPIRRGDAWAAPAEAPKPPGTVGVETGVPDAPGRRVVEVDPIEAALKEPKIRPSALGRGLGKLGRGLLKVAGPAGTAYEVNRFIQDVGEKGLVGGTQETTERVGRETRELLGLPKMAAEMLPGYGEQGVNLGAELMDAAGRAIERGGRFLSGKKEPFAAGKALTEDPYFDPDDNEIAREIDADVSRLMREQPATPSKKPFLPTETADQTIERIRRERAARR